MATYILSEQLKTKQNVTVSLMVNLTRAPPTRRQQEDQEVQKIMDSIAEETFEVRNLNMDIYCYSYRSYPPFLPKLLSKCKGIESIHLDYRGNRLGEWFSTAVRESCPNLQHLEILAYNITNEDWVSIVKSCRRLVSFISNAGLQLSLVKALHGHCKTLEHIVIHPYAGFDNDNRLSHPFPIAEEEFTSWVKTGSQARHRLCEQIGQLHCLRELNIVHDTFVYHVRRPHNNSPYIVQASCGHDISFMGLGHGLEMLADLKNLVNFSMSGVVELFPRKDIEWMVEHWPKLEFLTQAAIDFDYFNMASLVSNETGKANPCGDDYVGDIEWMRDLRKKRPSLEFETWIGIRGIGPYEEQRERNECVLYPELYIDDYQELLEEQWMDRVEMYEDQLARYI
ncbi:hypothetical protein BGX26_001709 [Mortierella sp. AD094]|nr:hypothetical protein BGX26_001709 [Mortierella sp. AD094]